ncbi:hypothetical protein L596_009917 [Steinernema carpocapsae]|uniref:Conserved oligomeric Golgi complex subunit 8 n=1 Tax=Steinernema carpocapsae TaxID=34508 RepID=A0A4U5PI23_STECR|nr:hypothetical protein L596_009917 [Steinernema carpocapsae]
MAKSVDDDMKTLSVRRLRAARSSLSSLAATLQDEIGDLAFNNYRTYADVGNTADLCNEMFCSMSATTSELKDVVPELFHRIKKFYVDSERVAQELGLLKKAAAKENPLWDLFTLPNVMEKCIRAGHYDSAYSLTNYATQLAQMNLTKNPVVLTIVDTLNASRHGLLDELFSKFLGPIDLSTGILVVNNIRKIPSISPTQLRVTILQYRDMYLEKQIIALFGQPGFLQHAIEVYRECMYETMVLYLAVFPENDFMRRFDMIQDPRWVQWQLASQNVVLQQWAYRNLNRLFDLIREAERKCPVDISNVVAKLMTFAFSFGRMGLDFRTIIVSEVDSILKVSFEARVNKATLTLANKAGIIGYVDIPKHEAIAEVSLEINQWDALCVYGNEVLRALNDLRPNLAMIQLNWIVQTLKKSFRTILTWLDRLMAKDKVQMAKKAATLFIKCFIPYVRKNLYTFFAYETSFRKVSGSAVSKASFESHFNLLKEDLFLGCVQKEFFMELYRSLEPEEKSTTVSIEGMDFGESEC